MCEAKSCGGLGFRDLRAFNLALLAKQGWRLIQNEEFLLFKIYKAKYFPNGSFLEADLGNNPSYAWRSIVEAREVLKKGIRWRVGDGGKIKIWKDEWLPSSSSSKVSSSPSGPIREATVNMLIDPINGWWRSNLILHLFTVEEADLILSIPLSKRVHVDKVYWPGNSTGQFSVKSAYYVARDWLKECSSQTEQTETLDASDCILWQGIWACKVPNKVKVFAWKACKNALPSRDSLAKRGVMVQHDCPVCQDHEESVLHMLWDCVWAKKVWAASPLVVNLNSGIYPNTKEWMKGFISHHGASDLDLVLVTAWRIWYNRNCVLYEGKNTAAPDVCPAAANYLTEFKEANRAMLGRSSQGITRWQPPVLGKLKLNCDGAFTMSGKVSGVGAIIRNHMGSVMAALSLPCHQLPDATVVEAITVYHGLGFAKEAGFLSLEVESDSIVVITALNSNIPCMSNFGVIMEDAKALSREFTSCSFMHVKREANKAAHSLAQYALNCDVIEMWLDEIPDFLHLIVSHDFHS